MTITKSQVLIVILIILILVFIIQPIVTNVVSRYADTSARSKNVDDRFDVTLFGQVAETGVNYSIAILYDKSNATEYLFYEQNGVGGITLLKK